MSNEYKAADPEAGPIDQEQGDEFAELRDLVARAQQGDAAALPRLRQYLAANPRLWRRAGDLALQAQAAWIRLLVGKDLQFQESVVNYVNDLKQKLGGPSPTPLEALLVERVVATWLRLHYCECKDAQQPAASLEWAEFELKRLKTVHDLHAKSIGSLALLRKLMPPEPATPTARAAAEDRAKELAAADEGCAKKQPAASVNGTSVNGTQPYDRQADKANGCKANGTRVNGHHNRLAALFETGVAASGPVQSTVDPT